MAQEINHIICETHDDGVKLQRPIAWCGHVIQGFEWHFLDAQHAALTGKRMGNPRACRRCVDKIKKALDVAAWRDA